MDYSKELQGLIKIVNSIFQNSEYIDEKGIQIPISKNPCKKEQMNWAGELKEIIENKLENNNLSDKNEFLLKECASVSNKINNQENIILKD